MVENDVLQNLKEKIREEIETIEGYMQREMETGTEDTLYRETKLFVFAKAIELNLENFLIYNEKNQNLIEKFVSSFLYEDNIIEKFYSYLYVPYVLFLLIHLHIFSVYFFSYDLQSPLNKFFHLHYFTI